MDNTKMKKLLDLIKYKRVSIYAVMLYHKVERYNEWRTLERALTEDEFKLLKEWLNEKL